MDTREHTVTVGTGATVAGWSDRYAGTIIEVSRGGKQVLWQEDKATRTDSNGMSDCQTYAYEADPTGRTMWFSLRKNGRWVSVGDNMRDGYSLQVGWRSKHYDFHF